MAEIIEMDEYQEVNSTTDGIVVPDAVTETEEGTVEYITIKSNNHLPTSTKPNYMQYPTGNRHEYRKALAKTKQKRNDRPAQKAERIDWKKGQNYRRTPKK